MTENEIKQALECLTGTPLKCRECPYSPRYQFPLCQQNIAKDAISLIDRQKAEIERYEKESNSKFDKWKLLDNRTKQRYAELYEEAKTVVRAEAIKEFAEKVLNEIREAIISNDKAIKEREEKHNVNRYEDNFCSMCDGKISALGGIRYFINSLVKEMVGDSDE